MRSISSSSLREPRLVRPARSGKIESYALAYLKNIEIENAKRFLPYGVQKKSLCSSVDVRDVFFQKKFDIFPQIRYNS